MTYRYDILILDVDGVLLDSNSLKKENIRRAAKPYTDRRQLDEFVEYFVSLNGVPREGKIAYHFGEGSEATRKILLHYNELNQRRLADVQLTNGVTKFLNAWSKYCPVYALSGGAQNEVEAVLKSKGIVEHFTEILGGPTTKSEHLNNMSLQGRILYVGDSRHDVEVAEKFGFDFLFMYRYSQFEGWKDYFQSRANVSIIADLTQWPDNLQPSSKGPRL